MFISSFLGKPFIECISIKQHVTGPDILSGFLVAMAGD
ncbi:hypothetical protein R52603_04489 [Paraburkholderia saeva]|uniref:Uncharacterized protein n=1 Tax=Paraburkholderia saeva TaxID=2777537 RepID=A0A9N8S2H1_9BURK|nr:hypothetical protein R52603_04489 [Paraburkholderia saeva]CAG4923068.1 hypothetical protein R70241_05123 [Paraburkholderia saeva]CAG4927919.1 hypothetical protein LMG31841_05753 [Paraburkholderia saeva]